MTPADTVLGPPGVFPPDPVGARVRRPGRHWRGTVVSRIRDGRCDVDWRGGDDDCWRETESVAVTDLCLDLSPPYSLDAGTRALWHLLDLGEQPLTAPEWWREGHAPRWWLRRDRCICCENDPLLPCLTAPVICTAAASESDPRRALALVLATVAGATGREPRYVGREEDP